MTVATKTIEAEQVNQRVDHYRQAEAAYDCDRDGTAQGPLVEAAAKLVDMVFKVHGQQAVLLGEVHGYFPMAVMTTEWLVVISPSEFDFTDEGYEDVVVIARRDLFWRISVVPRHEGLITLD
jgi:hypothetical protein